MKTQQSIKLSHPFHTVLLENEPILSEIETALKLSPQTLKLTDRQQVTARAQCNMSAVAQLLSKTVARYPSQTFDVVVSEMYNDELVLTHLCSLPQSQPAFHALRFARLPVPPKTSTHTFVVYSHGDKKAVSAFVKTLARPNVFVFFREFFRMTEMFQVYYTDVLRIIKTNHLSTIPYDFDSSTPPSIFGFDHQVAPLNQLLLRAQKDSFPVRRLKLTHPVEVPHKQYFERCFGSLTLNTSLSLQDVEYRCTFTPSRNDCFDVSVQAAKRNIDAVVLAITTFFNSLLVTTVLSNFTESTIKSLMTFLQDNPFRAIFFRKTTNKKNTVIAIASLHPLLSSITDRTKLEAELDVFITQKLLLTNTDASSLPEPAFVPPPHHPPPPPSSHPTLPPSPAQNDPPAVVSHTTAPPPVSSSETPPPLPPPRSGAHGTRHHETPIEPQHVLPSVPSVPVFTDMTDQGEFERDTETDVPVDVVDPKTSLETHVVGDVETDTEALDLDGDGVETQFEVGTVEVETASNTFTALLDITTHEPPAPPRRPVRTNHKPPTKKVNQTLTKLHAQTEVTAKHLPKARPADKKEKATKDSKEAKKSKADKDKKNTDPKASPEISRPATGNPSQQLIADMQRALAKKQPH